MGKLRSTYRKIHLFDVSLGKGSISNESNYVAKGMEIPTPIDTSIGKLGISIVILY